MSGLSPFLACHLCGKARAEAQGVWCAPCHEKMVTARPSLPRTSEDVLALPAYALPYVLWESGLADKGVTRLGKDAIIDSRPEDRAPYFYKGQRRWRPEKSLDDCAYLWERGKFQIDNVPGHPDWRWRICEKWHRECLVQVVHFRELPAAICRAALLEFLIPPKDGLVGGELQESP